jgi:hypothetical protein
MDDKPIQAVTVLPGSSFGASPLAELAARLGRPPTSNESAQLKKCLNDNPSYSLASAIETITGTAEPEKPEYVIVPGWGTDSFDVKRNGETVRRGFSSKIQAQSWIDTQIEKGL